MVHMSIIATPLTVKSLFFEIFCHYALQGHLSWSPSFLSSYSAYFRLMTVDQWLIGLQLYIAVQIL